jgi:urease accessory protein
MLRIDHVLGSRLEPAFSEEIHRLEHHGAVDVVNIPAADLARRRLLATTRGGEELAIALPRDQKLFDGAVLLIDSKRAIVVRAATERWMRLEPRSISDAIELGYHAGKSALACPLPGRGAVCCAGGPARGLHRPAWRHDFGAPGRRQHSG